MSPRQIELVQQSFARASRVSAHVAATFYTELFAIDPSLRTLFKGDMIAQGAKLMATLSLVVEGLTSPETLLPQVHALAVRHLAYGVEARHYDSVGIALIRTLKHELGAEFTPETREAWVASYALLARAMQRAAYGETPAPAR